jgi:hypothetical protein
MVISAMREGGQIDYLARRQPRKRPMQQAIESTVEASRAVFQQLMNFALRARCSKELPVVDDMHVGAFANSDGTPMGPFGNS